MLKGDIVIHKCPCFSLLYAKIFHIHFTISHSLRFNLHSSKTDIDLSSFNGDPVWCQNHSVVSFHIRLHLLSYYTQNEIHTMIASSRSLC